MPRSSIGRPFRHPKWHHTANRITIACVPGLSNCLATDLAGDSAIRLREIGLAQTSPSNKIVEANGRRKRAYQEAMSISQFCARSRRGLRLDRADSMAIFIAAGPLGAAVPPGSVMVTVLFVGSV